MATSSSSLSLALNSGSLHTHACTHISSPSNRCGNDMTSSTSSSSPTQTWCSLINTRQSVIHCKCNRWCQSEQWHVQQQHQQMSRKACMGSKGLQDRVAVLLPAVVKEVRGSALTQQTSHRPGHQGPTCRWLGWSAPPSPHLHQLPPAAHTQAHTHRHMLR